MDAARALSRAQLYSDGVDYRLLRLPSSGMTLAAGVIAEASQEFSCLIADKDELSLLLPSDVCDGFRGRLRHAEISPVVYRLITFDIELAPDLVGFLSKVTGALAAAGIPLLAIAAFSRDHIFVPADDLEPALRRLRDLQAESE